MNKLILTLLFISALLWSCNNKSDDIDTEEPEYVDTTTLVSSYNSLLSHNMGKDCQQCHQKGGNGKGWFLVSGTVYDSTMQYVFPNATVYLYDGIDNLAPLIATIEVDSLVNFYTTDSIDYKNGLHVEVKGKNLTVKMGSLIRSGSCNKCHGVTTNRIWVK
jgi:cytochrome c553